MQKVFGTTYLQALTTFQAAAASGPAGPLANSRLRLFVGNPTLSLGMVPGDFTEATFSGYAALAIVWDSFLSLDGEGQWVLRGVTAGPFEVSGNVANPQVTGLFVTDAAGAHVMFAEFLDVPRNLDVNGQFLQVTILARPNGDGGSDSVAP